MGCDPPVSTGGRRIASSPFCPRFFPPGWTLWQRVRARAAARPRPRCHGLRLVCHLVQEQIELINRKHRQRLDVLLCPVHCLDESGTLLFVRLVDSLECGSHALQRWKCCLDHPSDKAAHRLPTCSADCLQDSVLALVQRNGDAGAFCCHGRRSSFGDASDASASPASLATPTVWQARNGVPRPANGITREIRRQQPERRWSTRFAYPA